MLPGNREAFFAFIKNKISNFKKPAIAISKLN